MSFCNGVTIPAITNTDLEKDLTAVTGTSAALSTTGDNTNIYTLLLTAAGYTTPSVSLTTGTGGAKTFTSSPTQAEILTKFSTMADGPIETLLTSYGFTPLASMSATTADALQSQLDGFNNKVKFTYCYYNKLYRTALTNFFNGPMDDGQKLAIKLNVKLTVLVAGVERIKTYFQSKAADIMASSNNSNAIQTTSAQLQTQLQALSSKDADKQLYSRMVEYTEEKNQAHRNLLGMYTVLNLVALGLIFYIAKD